VQQLMAQQAAQHGLDQQVCSTAANVLRASYASFCAAAGHSMVFLYVTRKFYLKC
jgi:hypothetical protein